MLRAAAAAALSLCCLLALAAPRPAQLASASAPPAPTRAAVFRFANGLWFDGRAFAPRTVYSVGGVFRSSHDGPVSETVDLAGRYVVPPFAEAHNHHFMQGADNHALIRRYLAEGVFYAKNPNSLARLTDPIRHLFNTPESVDVTFSGGGLTSAGGHPVQIYDFLAERKVFPGWTKEGMRGQAYFLIDSERDLEAQWPLVRAGRPDFIKTYLEYSEEHAARKSDPKFYGRRGLDPALLPLIVRRAHRDGLRVSTHVNTAADFRNALRAGVDEINHLPLARLTEEDAREAARRGTVVVTTTLSHRPTGHVPDIDEVHRHNLRLLRRAGARLAVGTDDNNRTVREEAENLRRLGVFDNLTLLKIWTEETARAVFPSRKIGRLADGHEASFIALDGDPLSDFANVRRVSLRFKQGRVISVAAGDAAKPREGGPHPTKHP
jgi:cytosine/adenosine deaminase-related metal-dependent hydrolase